MAVLAVALLAQRAGATQYYINDALTNGDVYTSAAGSDFNSGTNKASPKATVTNLLTSYTLLAGDIVYIDTGSYSNYTISVTPSGTAASPITFQGSTNYGGGGTVFDRRDIAQQLFSLQGSSIRLADMSLRGAAVGVTFSSITNCEMERITSVSNTRGFYLVNASGNRFRHCVAARCNTGWEMPSSGANNSWDLGLMWSNTTAFSITPINGITVSNTAIVGGTAFGGNLPAGTDYDIFWNCVIASGLDTLSDLNLQKTNSFFSTWADPQVANAAALDFHPRSIKGRYNPATGTYVTDLVHSAMIDLGDPAGSYAGEPLPNGSNVNVGAFGGTSEASLSRTNPWVFALTYNDGGTHAGTGRLAWTYGNVTNGTTVALQYSPDGGSTWSNIATGLAVTNRSLTWNAFGFPSSLRGLWRLYSEGNPAVVDTNDSIFVLRAASTNVFSLYLNDDSTNGDIYCSAVGNDASTGLTNSAPRRTLQSLLDAYDLGPGDTVYIDTGTYTNPVSIVAQDRGVAGSLLVLQGSTNENAGGTVRTMNNVSVDNIVLGSGANYIRIADMILRRSRYGVSQTLSGNCEFERLVCHNNIDAFRGIQASNNRFFRCVAVSNSVGLDYSSSAGNMWDQCVSWSNTTAFQLGGGTTASISNSVVVGGTLFGGLQTANVSDYNLFWNVALGSSVNNLYDYQKLKSTAWHSTIADPLLADPANLDFHPRSSTGRYVVATGLFVTDAQHSPAIDFGDPARTFANETAPNGGRVNIGLYGDTPQASRSRTNAWLLALSLRDGGQFSVGDVLYWTGGNLPTSGTVRVEFSGDSCASWNIVASNIPASVGSYTWTNTNYPSSRNARWRVVYEGNTNVYDSTCDTTNFTFRNGAFTYYVNDASTNGDIYCGAIGNDNNLGTSSNSPKQSLSNLFATIDLDPGDVVYIDTGIYRATVNPVLTGADGGNVSNAVYLLGSTNRAAGGTVLDRQSQALGSYALQLSSVTNVELRDLIVSNASTGIRVDSSVLVAMRRVRARSFVGSGFHLFNSGSIDLSSCVASRLGTNGFWVQNSTGVVVRDCVAWRNGAAAVRVESGSAVVSNSILVASGAGAYVYDAATTNSVRSDYNGVFAESNALAAVVATGSQGHDSLSAWTLATGQDKHSIDADPQFADPDNNDFHLRTQTPEGRFDPALGLWVFDATTSPMIDSGHPSGAYSNELAFNGSRVNIGLFANTWEASKGKSTPRLLAASLRQGGYARGVVTLHWVAGNFTNGATVRVDFSPNGGNSWSVLSNGVAATNEEIQWDTTQTNDTPGGLWRVVSTSDGSVSDQTTNFFAVRNAPLVLYINDASVAGDVYASGPGASTNWAASAAEPLASLRSAIQAYDLEPGDLIYVDTGTYVGEAPGVELRRTDSGTSNAVVRFVGSTNEAAGGSVIDRMSSGPDTYGLYLADARWAAFSNLTFRGAGHGVLVTNSSDLTLSVRAVENSSNGFVVAVSTNISVLRAVAANNAARGLIAVGSSNVLVQSSIIWSNQSGGVAMQGGNLSVSNSVLTVGGSGHYLYEMANTTDVFRADYNDLLAVSPAQVAFYGPKALKNLSHLQAALGQDIHSLSHAPLFADPANGDFHPWSEVGRYQPGAGWVLDAATSPLIDTADPVAPFAAEPVPNGGRRNIGIYGNRSVASLSRTNGWLLVLKVNDGGSLRGTNELVWVAGGAATSDLVYIQFSADNGVTWTNVATNLSASAGILPNWDTTPLGSTLLGRWRIVSQTDGGIFATNETPFALNNGPLTYYVNDGSTNGDVYCSEPGSAINDGLSASTPANSINQILTHYTLAGDDKVLVDTGTYGLGSPVLIDANTQGGVTNPVVIQGSTNVAAGGTVLDRLGGDRVVDVSSTRGIRLTDLNLKGGRNGIRFNGATNCSMERVSVRVATGYATEVYGIDIINSSTGITMRGCAVVGVTNAVNQGSALHAVTVQNIRWLDGVMWSNRIGVSVTAGSITLSNSVFAIYDSAGLVYALAQTPSMQANYNDYFITNGGMLAQSTVFTLFPILTAPVLYDNMASWIRATGLDRNSLTEEPGFADPGALDFHLLSTAGRYTPGGVVTDTVSSLLIDAGDPGAPFGSEPSPNGGRINIGSYANTAGASRSPTNPAIILVSLNDGGFTRGSSQTLAWNLQGTATGANTRVEVMYNQDIWTLVASNLTPNTRSVTWNTTTWPSLPLAQWRVKGEGTFSNLVTASHATFDVRNSNFVFFVNDANTNGDVYCQNIGISTNTGLVPLSPLPSLESVLSRFDLEGGDVVYVDTGSYAPTQAVAVSQLDTGEGTNWVTIQGSTNVDAGGSSYTGFGFVVTAPRLLRLSDLQIQAGTAGLLMQQGSNNLMERVRSRGSGNGFDIRSSAQTRFEQCSAIGARTNGLTDQGSALTAWDHGLIWSNATGIRAQGSVPGLSVSNTVIGAVAGGQIALNVSGTYTSDYNTIFVTNGASVAQQFVVGRILPLQYESVARWARDTSRDLHSLSHDPQFVAPGIDFHPLSQAGHFTSTGLVVDAITSPLVDSGDPAALYTNEPAPNGSRLNLGLYGNTAEASLTPTNAGFLVVSFNDGGVASGTNVLLYWVPLGDATGMTVRLEYSPDNGSTWTNIATNLAAGTMSYAWDSTNTASSVLALWRVVSESDTNILARNGAVFALRNTPVSFYVNDSFTNGDVYCSGVGVSTNLGITPAKPKATIAGVLNNYDLEPGDTIYVDTGSYTSSASVFVSQLDAGDKNAGVLVTIQGSTNEAAGGTVLVRSSSGPVVEIFDAGAIRLRNLYVSGQDTGVSLSKAPNCVLEWVRVRNGTTGFVLSESPACVLHHCVARNVTQIGMVLSASSAVSWDYGILWSNGTYGITMVQSSLSVSNSIFGVLRGGSYAYQYDYLSSLTANHNDYLLRPGAALAEQGPPVGKPLSVIYENVARWYRDTGRDQFSLSHDPLFVDADQSDFHLRSQAGHYDTALGGFTNDAVTSPLIDAGALQDAIGEETAGNGGRVNIGLYGGTAWASRSPTNSALLAVALNDGGRAEGASWPLYWVAQGLATGHTVRLEFSSVTADVWSVVATGLPARLATPYFWNTTAQTSGILSLWRIVSEVETNVMDVTDRRFAVRNQPLKFYVNDASTDGDVYTSSIGLPDNTGTAPSVPRDGIAGILSDYDLEPGDVVYVDTGGYNVPDSSLTITRFDSWDQTTNLTALQQGQVGLTIQGSTNYASGGTVLYTFQAPVALISTQAFGTVLRDLTVTPVDDAHKKQGTAVLLLQSWYNRLEWLRSVDCRSGFYVNDSDHVNVDHCVAHGNRLEGVATLNSDDVNVRSCVLWSNQYGIFQNDTAVGTVSAIHNVFGSYGNGSYAYLRVRGTTVADYNDIFRTNGGFCAGVIQGSSLGGGTTRYESVTAWVTATTNDRRSLASNPRFLNPAAGDFHLASQNGHYQVGTGTFTNDSVSSPLIDGGNPGYAYSSETAPNGGRINIGLYGNTAQASHSPTNGILTTITFNDGGSGLGTITLRWNAAGVVTGQLVRLEFSSDGGFLWTNIASNVSASVGSYVWNSVPYGRAAAGLWRIVSQTDSNITDVLDNYFALRNGGSIPYYVNDTVQSGDIYCSNVGNDSFDGFLPSSPKRTIQALIDGVDLEPGDIVYVDTGSYPIGAEIQVGDLDAGEPTNRVVFQGSTNFADSGTVIDRQTGFGSGIHLFETAAVEFRDMVVKNAGVGVSAEKADDSLFYDIRSQNCVDSGFRIQSSQRARFENCVSTFNSNGVTVVSATPEWINGVIWNNQRPIVLNDGGNLYMRNSAVRAAGASARIFALSETAGSVTSEYNNLYREGGALMYEKTKLFGGNDILGALSEWQQASGQDLRSLSHDPQFAASAAGDFHLKSAQGRYRADGSLTNDPVGVFSSMLDAGDPAYAYTNERAPNGGRLNLGAYGNTSYASLSQTNPWLLAVSFNDEGAVIRVPTTTVYWIAGGMPTSAHVRLEQAADGVDFAPFATNVPAYQGTATWNVSTMPVTSLARWRVVLEGTPSVFDISDSPISIILTQLVIYVNDGDQTGDMYTTAAGGTTNSGLKANEPLDNPATAFNRYNLSAGDIMYIDTGTYYMPDAEGCVMGLVGSVVETGITGFPITIRGSTNFAAGGSVLVGVGGTNSTVFKIVSSKFIDLWHLRLTGGGAGLYAQKVVNLNLYDVQAYANAGNGFSLSGSKQVYAARCASWNNLRYGIEAAGDSDLTWIQGVVWSNSFGAALGLSATMSFSNSILHCANTNRYIYAEGAASALRGDYNFFWTENGAGLAYDGVQYPSLKKWQVTKKQEAHSARLDPALYSPADGDFHPRSTAGRFNPSFQDFDFSDITTSWVLDHGDPAMDYSLERTPNGNRMNVGLYGNTDQASVTVTDTAQRAMVVVALDDGGTVTGEQALVWFARAMSTGDFVYVDISTDDGKTWLPVATNVPAAQEGILWTPVASNASPVGRWRVTSQSVPALFDTNEINFAIRPVPVKYYVNDASTSGDIYSFSAGNVTNNGLSPEQPMLTIGGIFAAYDIEPGDQVLVDTGYYPLDDDISILRDDGGAVSNYVYITGSTNRLFGGTIVDRLSTNLNSESHLDAAFQFYQASFMNVSHLTIQHANNAIFSTLNESCIFSNLLIREGGRTGVLLGDGSSKNQFRKCVITRQLSSGLTVSGSSQNNVDSCVIWSNGGSAIFLSLGSLAVSNSILHAADTNYCYLVGGGLLTADYNDLHYVADARPGRVGVLDLEGVPQWTALTTQDIHSISADPYFADPTNDDYHVRSATGRYDPALEAYVVTDAVYSYTLDTGPPTWTYTNEPAPNGGRRNIGLYGDSREASMSRTNAWLLALTASAGGRAGGAFYLAWASGGMPPTNTVSLDFSYDGGTNWLGIATNVAVSDGQYFWNSLNNPFALTPIARWRVVLESNTNVNDMTDANFALNGPFRFYVNDAATNDDIYCSAVGNDMNLGIYSNSPKASLKATFDTWDLDSGDEVIMDTGNYVLGSNDILVVGASDGGSPADVVRLRGSTNGPWSLLTWTNTPDSPSLIQVLASYVTISGIRFQGGGVETLGTNITLQALVMTNGNVQLTGSNTVASAISMRGGQLKVFGASQDLSGFYIRDGLADLSGRDVTLHNSAIYGTQSVLVGVSGTNIALINNSLVANAVAVREQNADTSLFMRNNIVVADGQGGLNTFLILRSAGTLDSDYNNLVARNGAWIGNANGNWEKLLYWQRASGQDLHSMAAEPLFADETGGDFHLKSAVGRFTPGGFVADGAHSSSIDMGSPGYVYAEETTPNGFRINLGAYGNTAEASRSLTTPWLVAISANDGGVLKGTNILRWSAGNVGGSATVRIEYSPDAGATWTTVASSVSATGSMYVWDSMSYTSSLFALWRVLLESDTNVQDTVDNTFALRNGPVGFYVNDGATNGDVFTTGLGASTNEGVFPIRPKASIQGILNTYDTEPGDAIYVDTGSYNLTQDVFVIWSRGGDTNGNLVIQGSTNYAAGGTRLLRNSTAPNNDAVEIVASYVTLRDLVLNGGQHGIFVNSNAQTLIERVMVVSNSYGIAVTNAVNPIIRNARVWANAGGGIDIGGSRTVRVENCTFYGNQFFGLRLADSQPTIVWDNIYGITSTGTTALAGSLVDSLVDYNVYYFTVPDAAIYTTNRNLLSWQLSSARDYRSAITNPEMANAAGGDFHLKSTLGRYVDGSGWVTDSVDSWAIDKGSTNLPYAKEPLPNGSRINIGAYGNTEYASLGRTSSTYLVETRVLNTPTHIDETNSIWPLIWTVINVPTTETFRVEFSPDNGMSWYVLSNNVPAYQEFILWTTSPFFNTYRGRWRVVGINNTNFWDINDTPFDLFYGQFKINSEDFGGLTNRFVWRGAWAEYYQVQYSTNLISTNAMTWRNAVNGALPNQKANFLSTNGGDFMYADPESVTNRQRHYRVLWQQF